MKVTIACLLVSLCMDVCLSQSSTAKLLPPFTTTTRIASTGTTTNTSGIIIISTTSTNIPTLTNGSIYTSPTSGSTITNPASNGTVTTTSASRGFHSACMTPFLVVLSVVGFLLL